MSQSLRKPELDPETVKRWLAGQQAAQAVIEEERRHWLATLDKDAALQLYLKMVAFPATPRNEAEPSPVLIAMREATKRLAERGRS